MEVVEAHNLVERTLSHLGASRRGLLEMELFQVTRVVGGVLGGS